MPYVYLVKNISTKKKYLGVRYAKGCSPSDLWDTYFSSSKLVHKLIEAFGKEDFNVKILHVFETPEEAICKEAEYFEKIKGRIDYLNMCYSSGFLDPEINSKAGSVGGSIVYEKKIGIFRNNEERRKWASMGGKAGGNKQYQEKIGIHAFANDSEERRKWASMGGKASGNFKNKKFQSEMGKRGGKKNKGFKWYNDGEKQYKYTTEDQKKLNFEIFIENNSNFTKGTLKKK